MKREEKRRNVTIATPTYSEHADRIAGMVGTLSICGQNVRGGGVHFPCIPERSLSDKVNLNNNEKNVIEEPTAAKSSALRRMRSNRRACLNRSGIRNKYVKKAEWEAPLGGVISNAKCTEGISALSAIHRLPRKGRTAKRGVPPTQLSSLVLHPSIAKQTHDHILAA